MIRWLIFIVENIKYRIQEGGEDRIVTEMVGRRGEIIGKNRIYIII